MMVTNMSNFIGRYYYYPAKAGGSCYHIYKICWFRVRYKGYAHGEPATRAKVRELVSNDDDQKRGLLLLFGTGLMMTAIFTTMVFIYIYTYTKGW